MDESHRYRASAGVRAINELKPFWPGTDGHPLRRNRQRVRAEVAPAIRDVYATFEQAGSLRATAAALRRAGKTLPARGTGDWSPVVTTRAVPLASIPLNPCPQRRHCPLREETRPWPITSERAGLQNV